MSGWLRRFQGSRTRLKIVLDGGLGGGGRWLKIERATILRRPILLWYELRGMLRRFLNGGECGCM